MEPEQGVIIDTDVLINFFDPYKVDHSLAEQSINSLKIKGAPLFVSVVTEIELLQGSKPASEVRRLVKELTSFQTITLNEDISVKAKALIVKYSSSHGLKLGDSLIAATALHFNIHLLTFNKKDFRFITGLQFYEL
jgi:predicted nucleic acid-binding protein